MNKIYRTGFTLVEVLIAIVLVGIVATMVIPSILRGSGNKNRDAVAKEAFTTIGESFLACQDSGSCNTNPSGGQTWSTSTLVDSNGNQISGSATGVDKQFQTYLQNHLDYTGCSNPATNPETCFRLATQVTVNNITLPSATTMTVDITVPNNPVFQLYTGKNTTTGTVTRYTTKYGITGVAADKTYMDTVLNLP